LSNQSLKARCTGSEGLAYTRAMTFSEFL